MIDFMAETSKFKLAYSAEAASAAKAGQSSDKSQISNIKHLVFGISFLSFERPKGAFRANN